MVEGSANYVAYRAAFIDAGIYSADQVRSCMQYVVAANQPPVPPLAQLEGQLFYTLATTPPIASVYFDAYLAVERAIQSMPLLALPTTGATSSVSFPDAFQAAFGRSVADFYMEFETYRQTWQAAGTVSACAVGI